LECRFIFLREYCISLKEIQGGDFFLKKNKTLHTFFKEYHTFLIKGPIYTHNNSILKFEMRFSFLMESCTLFKEMMHFLVSGSFFNECLPQKLEIHRSQQAFQKVKGSNSMSLGSLSTLATIRNNHSPHAVLAFAKVIWTYLDFMDPYGILLGALEFGVWRSLKVEVLSWSLESGVHCVKVGVEKSGPGLAS
jgi:hypothetical protein